MKNSVQHTTYLDSIITRNDYFQRSINISYDQNNLDILENFYCPISYEQVIIKLIDNIEQTQQSAFTWTGAYGSGKSSLAIFLQALMSEDKSIRSLAYQKLSSIYQEKIKQFFDINSTKWKILNIVGKNQTPESLFKEVLELDQTATTQNILEKLSAYTKKSRLIIFIDEMGKLFDAATKSKNSDDIYFLQQLAEFANRSQGRMIFIGILHQSFIAYARQTKYNHHNEWLKIQGRFIDCSITLSVDEQIHLVGQIIRTQKDTLLPIKNNIKFNDIIADIVKNIAEHRKTDILKFSQVLSNIFPLHPIVAILLCQLSKKNFGQSQRSIFSFLMSAEPNGFGHYLKTTTLEQFNLYSPARFWDYLESNLNSVIQNSEYAKRWLLAQMAVHRYEQRNDESIIDIIKTICVINIFADDTGLHPNRALLQSTVKIKEQHLDNILHELETASLIFYRKHTDSYSLSEGSDFDLQQAIEEYLKNIDILPFEYLNQLSPIIAKKHYQKTGNLRWLDVKLLPFSKNLDQHFTQLKIDESLIGYFCLLLPNNEYEHKLSLAYCQNFYQKNYPHIAISIIDDYVSLIELFREHIALNHILNTENKLLNDKIARQETEGRFNDIENRLTLLLKKTMNGSIWYHCHLPNHQKPLNLFQISTLASQIADNIAHQSIICNNELVNRNQPSPSAKGAIRELLKRMIENSDEETLGITKYPAERGIYESILLKNGIHQCDIDGNYFFTRPNNLNFVHVWNIADEIIRQANGQLVTAKQIYQAWQALPIGIKAGLHDILFIAYLLSRYHELAFYINEEYKPNLQYLLAEYLIKDAKSVGIREVSQLQQNQPWIYTFKEKVEQDDVLSIRLKGPMEKTPLSISRGLISLFLSMPSWIQRTNFLSDKTKQLRNVLKQANDPNKLLFDELPRFFNPTDTNEEKADKIINSLYEMDYLYQNLVKEINENLIHYLKASHQNGQGFSQINTRAKAIFSKSGDYVLDSFISRLTRYDGSWKNAESLISLLAGNKPAKNWIDQDILKAKQQLATFCHQFLETEINDATNKDPHRLKIGLISKSPKASNSKIFEAHITSQNHEKIHEITQQCLQHLQISELDKNDKVAVIAQLLENLEPSND